MSATDEALQAKSESARSSHRRSLATPPARRLAAAACVDARPNIEAMPGLRPADAHITRNAGGIPSENALRCLVSSHHLPGTREVAIINHTDCDMLTSGDEELCERLKKATGAPGTHHRSSAPSWTCWAVYGVRSGAGGQIRGFPATSLSKASSTMSGAGA